MAVETTQVLIVGAGQAGIAMSEHLSLLGIAHIVLERDRIAERWRSARWDSLVANGPAWHDRFPGMEFPQESPDAFVPKDQVADYFVAYAQRIHAPIRCGVEVTCVRRLQGRHGFHVDTSQGPIEAGYVVAATGAFQTPVIPALIPGMAGLLQMHSADYRHPGQLSEGAVMVVGAGSSGVQIADELLRAGKRVYLSVGAHERPPRSYRGRDFCWWLGVLHQWDAEAQPGVEHTPIAVSGAYGGFTVDFRRLAAAGMTLVGRTEGCAAGVVAFAADLQRQIEAGDSNYLGLLDAADAYIARHGLAFPPEPAARALLPLPACVAEPLRSLDLQAAGITTILWATGYTADYRWLPAAAVDDHGKPRHRRGVAAEPGVYFLGLPWQTRRGSAFIWGVWHDARELAEHIARQQAYLHYAPGGQRHPDLWCALAARHSGGQHDGSP